MANDIPNKAEALKFVDDLIAKCLENPMTRERAVEEWHKEIEKIPQDAHQILFVKA